MAVPANRNNSIPLTSTYTYRNYNSAGALTSQGGPITIDTVGPKWKEILAIVSANTANFRQYKRWNRPINDYSKYVYEYYGPHGSMSQKGKAAAGNYSIYDYDSGMAYLFGVTRDLSLVADDPTQKVYSKLRTQISNQKDRKSVV